jgi:hypothetical protein
MYNETRFKMLVKSMPERAEALLQAAQDDAKRRWALYEHLAAQKVPLINKINIPKGAVKEEE